MTLAPSSAGSMYPMTIIKLLAADTLSRNGWPQVTIGQGEKLISHLLAHFIPSFVVLYYTILKN